MQSVIDIRLVSNGSRFDVSEKETFEINMGGVSLLNLGDRTATYSNSFKLPPTPNNQNLLLFSSQNTVKKYPLLDVIITKGLFQQRAKLKVISFDTSYNCTVTYTNSLEVLKNTNAYDLNISTPYNSSTFISNNDTIQKLANGGSKGYYVFNGNEVSANALTIPYFSWDGKGLFFQIKDYFDLVETVTGVKITSSIINSLENIYILNPHAYRTYSVVSTTYTYKSEIDTVGVAKNKITVADILKTICQMFALELKISAYSNSIELVPISEYLLNLPIYIDGFTGVQKGLYTDYLKVNNVNYDIEDAEKLTDNYAGDVITGNGIGTKEILKINNTIPKAYTSSYLSSATEPIFDYQKKTDKIVIASLTAYAGKTQALMSGTLVRSSIYINAYNAYAIDMNGFYSTTLGLNKIFANPIILDANRWFNPLEANDIITNRVINSVQLGGKYWVDSMAYNLTTGQSKLKLIKI
jgi:hypothetical protein